MTAAADEVRGHLSAMRALYGQPATDLARPLVEIGEALAAQCSDLQRDLSPDRCERLAANLQGAARHVLRVREALLSGGAAR
ncbi:MAG: hypothetical protein ACXIUZ_01570 [Lysobacteraceae bacterium]